MAEIDSNWTQVEIKVIREQLNRILQSALFVQSDRQSRFLKYIVEATLAGDAERLKQFLIGLEVFDRDESFDPVVDSIVRVEAGRLRSKLREYYIEVGQNDRILIELPKGGYGVQIQEMTDEIEPANLTDDITNAGQSPDSVRTHKGTTLTNATVAKNPTIVVLPFDNLSTDPEQEYFSDGITEDITTDLSKLSGLFVISRHSAFTYKGKAVKVRDLSADLGVRYVLEGSVRKAGDRLRINAQLIDALTDNHIWSDRYDRDLNDIFTIQDEVSRMIVTALEVKLTIKEEDRLGHKGTNNVEAHDLFLRGQEQFYLFTPEGINNGIELFSKSIDLDPHYAEAYAWKSRATLFPYIAGINSSEEETVKPALTLAIKAVELDDLLPLAHANLAWALKWLQKTDEAIIEAKKAIELNPNYAEGYLWQSMILSSSGRGQEALAAIEKGIRINPHYTVTYILALGLANFTLGLYKKALTHFQRGIERNPNFIPNHIYKTCIYGLLEKKEDAEAAKVALIRVNPDYKNSAAYNFYTDKRLDKLLLDGSHKAGLNI